MRKILTGVLGVAGLLAVVLALAASPASAAKVVVTVETADPGEAGEYTVSWETQGGCDPGAGTSGPSGSVSLTVSDATPNDDTANTGPQQETGVVTDDVCNYSWEATFTNAAGAGCVVGEGTEGADGISTATDNTITLTTGACATTNKLMVTVKGHGNNAGDCIPKGDKDGTHSDLLCATLDSDQVTALYRVAGAGDVSDSASAASATTFTVTATPQAVSGEVPEGCEAVSEDTETDYGDNDLQKAELTVVDEPLGGASCVYTVTAALPPGFAAGDGSARSEGNSQEDVDPTADGPDGAADSDDDGTTAVGPLVVSIAAVKVYLVQTVDGDAGGASAEYEYDAPCGAPGLPGALEEIPKSGGIRTVGPTTVVELRTGSFNITGALDLSEGRAPADGKLAHALDASGDACEATVSVSGVPAHCSVSHNSPASLATGDDSVRIDVDIDCTEPAAPDPMPEQPAEDDTGAMTDADDMTGTDDGGGEDMTGGDGHMDDDGMGDMGPPADVPTG